MVKEQLNIKIISVIIKTNILHLISYLVIRCFLIYDKRNVNYAISNNHSSEIWIKLIIIFLSLIVNFVFFRVCLKNFFQ